jgi:hypothetical protein
MLIEPQELAEHLDRFAGGNRNVVACTLTPVKMNKTGNPYYGKVDHLAERAVQFGANYQNAVNKRWERGEKMTVVPFFQAEQLWKGAGERVNNYVARKKPSWKVSCLVDGKKRKRTAYGWSLDEAKADFAKRSPDAEAIDFTQADKGGALYLVWLLQTRKGVNVSLRQEKWLDRETGEEIPYEKFAAFLPPKPEPCKKQRIGEVTDEEVFARTTHIENVLYIRSLNLDGTGAQTIQVNREPGQQSV